MACPRTVIITLLAIMLLVGGSVAEDYYEFE